jgi:hypothetical protein
MFVPGAAISGFSRSPTVEVGSTKLDDAAHDVVRPRGGPAQVDVADRQDVVAVAG